MFFCFSFFCFFVFLNSFLFRTFHSLLVFFCFQIFLYSNQIKIQKTRQISSYALLFKNFKSFKYFRRLGDPVKTGVKVVERKGFISERKVFISEKKVFISEKKGFISEKKVSLESSSFSTFLLYL